MNIATTRHFLGILLVIASALAYLVYISDLTSKSWYEQFPLYVIAVMLVAASLAAWKGAWGATQQRKITYGFAIVLNILTAVTMILVYSEGFISWLVSLFDLHAVLYPVFTVFVLLPISIIVSGIVLSLPATHTPRKTKPVKANKRKTKK